ncbi:MAG: HAMP domain-containing protein [Candidatus Omnitrophica bacterium]|nr:HAMP domain-containing protein [Candidatus Omnitrophota bacterium]MBU4478502.1 HAMP domain-containing protein [Candidatus Omnitrophota bacterium]MCG2704398.1 HAMP domain-containing protein [Candidatus Omnitrophota bacterium]
MARKGYFIRKNLLIQRKLQFKYMAFVLAAILITSAVIVLSVYLAHWSLLRARLPEIQAKAIIDEVSRTLNTLLLFEIPLAVFIAVIASIIVSHKVAGPVYHLQKVAREVARGDLTRSVHLRRDDELKNLSEAFNSVIDNMHVLVSNDRKLIFELSKVADTLYGDLKDKKINEQEALVLIRKVNDLIGELKTLIMHYKIEKS